MLRTEERGVPDTKWELGAYLEPERISREAEGVRIGFEVFSSPRQEREAQLAAARSRLLWSRGSRAAYGLALAWLVLMFKGGGPWSEFGQHIPAQFEPAVKMAPTFASVLIKLSVNYLCVLFLLAIGLGLARIATGLFFPPRVEDGLETAELAIGPDGLTMKVGGDSHFREFRSAKIIRRTLSDPESGEVDDVSVLLENDFGRRMTVLAEAIDHLPEDLCQSLAATLHLPIQDEELSERTSLD